MTLGSPGMEVPDGNIKPFEVMAFGGDGRIRPFRAWRSPLKGNDVKLILPQLVALSLVAPLAACRVALVRPITDDPDMRNALDSAVTTYF